MLHRNGLVRVHSDIRIGTRYEEICPALKFPLSSSILHRVRLELMMTPLSRTDKTETMESKVAAVQKHLAQDQAGGMDF